MKLFFSEDTKIFPPDEPGDTWTITAHPTGIEDLIDMDDGAYAVGKVLDPIAEALNGTSDHEYCQNFWYFKSEKMAKEFLRRSNVHLNRLGDRIKAAYEAAIKPDKELLKRTCNKGRYPEEDKSLSERMSDWREKNNA